MADALVRAHISTVKYSYCWILSRDKLPWTHHKFDQAFYLYHRCFTGMSEER